MKNHKHFLAVDSIWRLVLIVIIFIVSSEIADTLLLGALSPISTPLAIVVEVIFNSLTVIPIVYYLLFRPLTRFIKTLNEAEANVKESDSRYRLLAENISDVIWIFDLESGRFTYISPSVKQLRGFTVEEATNQKFEESMTAPSLQQINGKIGDRLEKFIRKEYHSDTDVIEQTCKDGSTVWVEIKTRFVENELTGKIEVYGVSRDITLRKLAEEKLKISDENLIASNTYLQSLINSNSNYLIRTDMEGRYSYINEPFIEKFGFSRDELIGKSGTISVHADDLDKMMQTVSECIQNPGRAFPIELRKYNVQGEIFFTDWEFILTNDTEGNPEAIQCVGHDITARKKAEDALRDSEGRWKTLVATLPDFIALHDIEGRYLFLNHYAEGFSEKDVVGRSLFDFLNDDSKTVYRQHFDACIETKENQHFTYFAYGKNRTITIYEGYLVPVLEKGLVVNVLSVAKDITEARHAEDALRESEDRLQHAEQFARFGHWEFSLDEKKMRASESAINIYGFTQTEIPLSEVQSVVLPEYRSLLDKSLKDLIEQNTPYDVEFKIRRVSDGEIVDIHSKAEYHTQKRVVFGIVHDITERKKAVESLRESEEKYRSLFNANKDGITIFLINEDETISPIIIANNSAAEMLGCTVQEITGKHPSEFEIQENDGVFKQRMEELKSKGTASFETKLLHKNGNHIQVEINVRLITINNKPALMNIVRDITERKQMESALRESELIFNQLMEHSPIYIFFKDENIRATRLSRNFETMIGRPIPELLGKNMYELFPSDFAKHIVADDMRILNEGKRVEVEEELNGRSYLTIKFPISIEGKLRYLAGFTIDITERKQAEEALRQSDQTYRGILDSITEAVYIESPDGKFLDVNRAAERMYGYTKEEFVGRTPEFLSAPGKNDLSRLGPLMEKALNGEPQTFEFWGRRKDGTIFPKDVSNSLGYYFGEKVNIAVARDISERKIAERSLIESENNYRALIQNMKVGIVVHNPDTSILLSNPMASQLLGLSNSQMMGKTAIDPAWCFTRENGTRLPLEEYPVNRALNSLEPISDHILGIIRTDKEKPVWVQCSAHQIKEMNGVVHQIVVTFFDVTERKNAEDALRESENRFRKILQDVHTVAVQGYAPDGTTQYWNEASERLYGYTEEEAIGRNLLDLIIPPEMRSGVEQAMQLMAATGVPIPASELSLMRKDRTRVSVFSSHTIVQIPGRAQELFCIDIDLTDRKISEEALRNAQKLESIGTLAGGIAHDFNNLLSAMMGNISLAQSRMSPDHPALKNIDRALLAMERAATLTKQMLAYSGKGKFQIREIDLVRLVQEHINLFEVTLQKNVQLVSNLSPTPVYIKGDPAQIEQIVMNLIINGGEAIGKKQGFVSIEVMAVTMLQNDLAPYSTLTNNILSAGSYALLQVTDNGSGMSKETQQKIFDPFFTTKFVGRGLGLSAVLGIIRGNEGGIAIDTEEGLGTTFRVLLPLIQSSDPEKVLSTTVSDAPIIENIKIFVIDDEQFVAEMAVDILEWGKYQHVSAIDPEKGIALYKEQWQTIDMVILDYSMPKMNGKEVFIELRKINPNVKVIISSGYTEEEIFELMGDDMPNAFIQKPYTQESLLSIVKRILESA